MSDDKMIKIVYGLTWAILTAFFGFGVYFLLKGVMGAGLLAVGVGLTGSGAAILLGQGLVFSQEMAPAKGLKKAYVSDKSMLKQMIMSVDASLQDDSLESPVDGVIMVCETGLAFEKLREDMVYVLYSDMQVDTSQTGTIVVHGQVDYQKEKQDITVTIQIANKLKAKTFLQEVGERFK